MPRRRQILLGALAASILFVLAVRAGLILGPSSAERLQPGALAQAAVPEPASLPTDWSRSSWAPVRGPGDGERASFRLGVAAVDLAVAWPRMDRLEAGYSVAAIDGLVAGTDLAAAVRPALADLQRAMGQGSDAEVTSAVARTQEAIEAIADPGPLALGKWLEAVRLAALAGNAESLREPWATRPRPEDAAALAGRQRERVAELRVALTRASSPESLAEVARLASEAIAGY